MLLIERAWRHTYPEEQLETRELVSHEIKRLRKKDNWGTQAPRSDAPPSEADMESEDEVEADKDEDYEPSGVEPSWAKRIKFKMKNLFCMESHGQYMSHVSEKEARRRHKELMRQLGATVNSGFEERITNEEEGVQQHYQ